MADFDADVAIIGAGMGGIATGALLADKGLKVVILEQAAKPGGLCAGFTRNGYSFQTAGNILNGFELGGGHERMLAKLGLFISKTQLNPGLQLVLPNHRLNFSSAKLELLEEFEREFPENLDGIKKFWQKLEGLEKPFYDVYRQSYFRSPNTLKEKYTYYREIHRRLAKNYEGFERSPASLLKKTVGNPEFKRLLDILCFFYAQLPLEGCSSLFFAYLMGLPRRGIFYIEGGIQALLNQLINYITKHGGKIKCNSRVNNIITEGKKAVGVKLADGQSIRARHIVANTTLWSVYEKLLETPPSLLKKFKHIAEDITPQWQPFTVYLGVDEGILPNEMRENVFLLTDYQRLGDTGTLFVSINPKTDKQRAPQGKRALTATCFLPRDKWERGSNYKELKQQLMEQVIKSLGSLIPFIDEGIEFRDAATPLTIEKYTLRHQGMVTGLASTSTGFGFKDFSNYTLYKNLYLVGDTSFPGFGTNLVSISALNLANIIAS